MATYTKALKSITVTTVGGQTVSAADTATAPIASNALAEFEAFHTMHIPGENNETLIPFHAVDNIVVTKSTASVTKDDPYGCDESGESDDSGESGGDGNGGN